MNESFQLKQVSASLFDLDHTLLKVNISYRFGVYLYQQNVFSFFCMLQLSLIYTMHKLHLLSMRQLHIQIFRKLFKGRPFQEIAQHIDLFLDGEIPSSLNSVVFGRFKLAKQSNAFTAILSSSPNFLVEAIAKRLEFATSQGSLYSLDKDQKFSHISSLIEGQEKADYIFELKKSSNLNIGEITAYSDSILDLPFLSAADKAVGVNPDPRLRKICQEKGWQVI